MSDMKPINQLFSVPQLTEEYFAQADAENAKRDAEIERERMRDLIDQRVERLSREPALRLPDETYEALIRGKLDDHTALLAVKTWLADPAARPCLVLAGSTGCGKTVAAAYALSERGGAWMPAARMVRVFMSNFGDGFAEQERCRSAGLLVVDDVGTEDAADRIAGVLTELLDSRCSRKHRTIITANMTKKAFADRYASERLMSRMVLLSQWVASKDADLRRA